MSHRPKTQALKKTANTKTRACRLQRCLAIRKATVEQMRLPLCRQGMLKTAVGRRKQPYCKPPRKKNGKYWGCTFCRTLRGQESEVVLKEMRSSCAPPQTDRRRSDSLSVRRPPALQNQLNDSPQIAPRRMYR
mmetsp:Transcript_8493/g.31992  ORF Transcript_8493/g.31992 Transcript_8493/m.31992 type:complete len:133 (-) Transcript_8493:879-1277(-)